MIRLTAARALAKPQAAAFVPAQLLSVSSTTRRATVSIAGGPAVALPYGSSALTDALSGFTTVLVGRNGAGQQYVLCGLGAQTAAAQPPPPPPDVPKSVQTTTTIKPTATGTYSAKWGHYYAWELSYGPNVLWQGNAYGSGVLSGIALYGKQLKALGATSIDAITLHTPFAHNSGTVQVQGDTRSSLSGAPTPSGTTASGGPLISLGATLRENLRTGAINALVLVGTDYLAVQGLNRGSGMAMTVTYTRSV